MEGLDRISVEIRSIRVNESSLMEEDLPTAGAFLPDGGSAGESWSGGLVLDKGIGQEIRGGSELVDAEVAGLPSGITVGGIAVTPFEGGYDELSGVDGA